MIAVKNVPIAPTATPSAATVPMSTFGPAAAGFSGFVLSRLTAVSAVALNCLCASPSAAAARLATCSSMKRTNFL